MLILASASPARKALLRRAGFTFRVVLPSHVAELRGRGRSLEETVRENARRKAAAVSRRHPTSWVLAADTMIQFEGRLYGKPAGRKEGLDLLLRMSGRTHTLATGFELRRGNRIFSRVVKSYVTLRPVDRPALERHARSPERFAGGYSIRENGDPVVERVRGSFTNVVGLPLEAVQPLLERVLRA